MINVEQNDISDASVSHVQGDTFVTLSCVTVHVCVYIYRVIQEESALLWEMIV